MTVARQEFLDAERFLGMSRSDQHDVSNAARDHPRPAKEERAHENLAQVSVRLHDCHQMFVIHLDNFTWLGSPYSEDCASAREEIQLARDLTGLVHRDESLEAVRQLHDIELSGNNHEKIRAPDTGSHQYFTSLDLSQLSLYGNAGDLRLGQGGKCLIA
jgi:hypothetical protein